MGAPFVSQEEHTLAVEKRLAPVGRNRALPYQELSSHFTLLLKAEPPSVHGNTLLTPDEKGSSHMRELPS